MVSRTQERRRAGQLSHAEELPEGTTEQLHGIAQQTLAHDHRAIIEPLDRGNGATTVDQLVHDRAHDSRHQETTFHGIGTH
ncbi:hypothetical protein D3C78_1560930 [compost metagenome]